jgi:adapter protein MecA 1/2
MWTVVRIEKISESQIKFILSQTDLSERNLKVSELAYGSEKMQCLFHDMLERAMRECGFQPENNVPLMIEAIPLSSQSIMIIVTKVSNTDEFEQKINFSPRPKEERIFMKRPMMEDVLVDVSESGLTLYSFASMALVSEAASRIRAMFSDDNSLHKVNGRYYLLLKTSDFSSPSAYGADTILCEYGQRHPASRWSKYYLMEHGEVIIKEKALNILAQF